MRDHLPPNVMSLESWPPAAVMHAWGRRLFGAVRARHNGLKGYEDGNEHCRMPERVSGGEKVLGARAVVAPTGDPIAFINNDPVTEGHWATARATRRVGMAE